jgi:predicted Zn-dependent protease
MGFSGRGFKLFPVLIFIVGAIGYILFNRQSVPITGRTQIVGMSKEQEAALGLQSFRQIMAKERIITGTREADLIREIGGKLVAANNLKSSNIQWSFNLIDNSETVNAFALPGGHVAIYTGILPVMKNRDGIATVMGHEIAHVIARHGAERMAHQTLTELGGMALQISMSEMPYENRRMIYGAFGVGAQVGVLLPFSRKHESEADYIGLKYLTAACFNPEEAPKLWERMGALGSRQPSFLATHPNPKVRAAKFKEWLPEALKEYEEKCR